MAESLFSKYRPQRFEDLVGQRLSALALKRMVEIESVPQGLLFSGPSGSGKTSSARILAASLADDSTQIIEIDAASNRGVENVRSLIETLRYSSGGNVIVLDEAHNLTREAFNALLKMLEEPTQGTSFILLTTDPDKIPETVKSRLMEFEFRQISSSDIFDRLLLVSSEEKIDVEDALLKFLADASQGNLRTALVSLELAQLAEVTTLEQYRELVGISDYSGALVQAMVMGDHSLVFLILEDAFSSEPSPESISRSLLTFFRDLLILRAGGTLSVQDEALEVRKSLAVSIPREDLLSVVKLMWDLRTKIRVTDNPRGSIEMAVILMSDILSHGREIAPPVVIDSTRPSPSKATKMSLSEMRAT